MKKLFRQMPDVPQTTADQGTEIIERHFNAYGVKRAIDLPEEGKVRLYRDLQQFFLAELPNGPEVPRQPSWWKRRMEWFYGFFGAIPGERRGSGIG